MANAALGSIIRHLRGVVAGGNTKERTDRQLLQAFAGTADQAAFAALVARHGPMVLRVCRRVLGCAHDAEDAFQATFLVLAGNAAGIRKREALASWLHGVAYRVALQAKRAAGRRRAHEREAQAMAPRTATGGEDWREVQAILDEEIQALPDRYRAPFVLCFLEGKSRAEAARELGLKEGTVWSRLSQARKHLQRRLSRCGLSLSAVLGAAALSAETAKAVPAALAAATVRAAVLVAAGQPAAAGVASAQAAALAKGVSRVMFTAKLKTITLYMLAAGLVAFGAGVALTREASAPPPPEQPPMPPPAPVAPPRPRAAVEEKGDAVTVHGRVLDPEGKPVAGAEVTLWWHFGFAGYYQDWHPRTTKPLRPRRLGASGADGRFRATFAKSEIDENPMAMWERPWRLVQIVAAARGYGPAWASLENPLGPEVALRLARDDVPIRGKVSDLQGRPVAGATVRVGRLTVGGDVHNSLWQPTWAGLPENVTTGFDGRFVLTGVGRDRNVLLHIAGPTIEHKMVGVRTETPGGDKGPGPDADVVAEPTKPVEGTVRAGDTGRPLAGVVVYGEEKAHERRVRAVTDDKGRYRLVGLPKAAAYTLTLYPAVEQGYLSALRRVDNTEGLRPVTADVELRRGVEVRCRLLDKKTREPVHGVLHYTPLKTNPHFAEAEWQTGYLPTREAERLHVPGPDGVFRLVVYPGPGLLYANLQGNHGRYQPVRVTPADRETARGDHQLDFADALGRGYRLINPLDPDKSLVLDVELEPATPVRK
jgi:RNA polymerase sigma factor (sigma-70 family)